ncbi:DUF7519 family protein [Halostella salina]|uniref:DUF7519 family protein n=1 Tax=Halostella salina TaxID=1547897 RepID=UPI000EF7F04A|nr:hypothetical protein [Halostella salina]
MTPSPVAFRGRPARAGSALSLCFALGVAALVAPSALGRSVVGVAAVGAAGTVAAPVLGRRWHRAVGVLSSTGGGAAVCLAVGLAAVLPGPLTGRAPLVAALAGVFALALGLVPVVDRWTGGFRAAGATLLVLAAVARSALSPVGAWHAPVTVAFAVLAWDSASTAAIVGERAGDGRETALRTAVHAAGSVAVGAVAAGAAVALYGLPPANLPLLALAALGGAAVAATLALYSLVPPPER